MSDQEDTADLLVRVVFALVNVDVKTLWYDCLSLGDTPALSHPQLLAAATGDHHADPHVTRLVHTALNERLLDLGLAPLLD